MPDFRPMEDDLSLILESPLVFFHHLTSFLASRGLTPAKIQKMAPHNSPNIGRNIFLKNDKDTAFSNEGIPQIIPPLSPIRGRWCWLKVGLRQLFDEVTGPSGICIT